MPSNVDCYPDPYTMVAKDVCDGLSPHYERRNQIIESIKLFGCDTNPFPTGCQNVRVVGLCNLCTIVMFLVVTVCLLSTAVTDMWKTCEINALFNDISGAILVTVYGGAFFTQPITRSVTKMFLIAFLAIAATDLHILFSMKACNAVPFDFFRDRGWIFAQSLRYRFQWVVVI